MSSRCRFSCWLILAAVGCEQTAPESARDPALHARQVMLAPQRAAAASLAVYDNPQSNTPQTKFSISHTRDLHICSSWPALEGEHFETRQFYAPGGEVYYQKLIPFSTDIDEPYPFTHSVSMPHATSIQPVMPNERGELVVCDDLAVAGAWIGDHQLTGNWRLDVLLDDAKTPALSQSFEIVP